METRLTHLQNLVIEFPGALRNMNVSREVDTTIRYCGLKLCVLYSM
jgi:hypothetical protein